MGTTQRLATFVRNQYNAQKWRAFTLLAVASIVGSSFQIPILKEAALQSTLLFVLAILFDIHRVAVSSSPPKTFQNCNDATQAFCSLVVERMTSTGSANIKWFGMSMKYGAPVLVDLVRRLRERSLGNRLDLHICMLDPEWSELAQINPAWAAEGRAAYENLQRCAVASGGGGSSPCISMKIALYRHMPNWHGFMVDGRYLYLSTCKWSGIGLLGGENEYRFFDTHEGSLSEAAVEQFCSWFSYCER